MDYDIFEDRHLRTAEENLAERFEEAADWGDLDAAETHHTKLLAVRAELERRAIANIQSGKAA